MPNMREATRFQATEEEEEHWEHWAVSGGRPTRRRRLEEQQLGTVAAKTSRSRGPPMSGWTAATVAA
ncbi:hypothetical protein L917_06036 [Phytophthora nicotianae]|uniref:Uncharacterized protein n=1 Tax=Phytophthora nicotianae TaxID=4792 RepID=W2H5L4_PHYNI|nr:hypothetical protein L915_06225 [Phytophthora nicotianae]ETL96484.1 hypothetical protein L917_06036 [Phytophthora nicotianae]